jgi:DNA-cytosine methyltransferase
MGIKVCSLFDGCSGTQMALKNLGVEVDQYFSSEIDKYAMQVTQKNFPETIQLGDITDIKGKDLPKIDLIVGGSPCQGFSFAGKQKAFKDERSALFFEFIRLLKEIKPKYFLLENVVMKKEFQQVITDEVSKIYPQSSNSSLFGIEPIMINSALLSAQNRKRLYWTNIPNVEQPEDLGIVLKDVLEDNFLADRDKSYCIDANYYKGGNPKNYFEKSRRQLVFDNEGKPKHKAVKNTERNLRHTKMPGQKSLTLTATMYKGAGNNGMTLVPLETYNTPKQVGVAADINGHDSLKRVYSENGKSPTVNAHGGGNTEPKVAVTSYREVRTEKAKEERKRIKKETGKDHTPFRSKELIPRDDGKVGAVTPSLNKDHTISVKEEELT